MQDRMHWSFREGREAGWRKMGWVGWAGLGWSERGRRLLCIQVHMQEQPERSCEWKRLASLAFPLRLDQAYSHSWITQCLSHLHPFACCLLWFIQENNCENHLYWAVGPWSNPSLSFLLSCSHTHQAPRWSHVVIPDRVWIESLTLSALDAKSARIGIFLSASHNTGHAFLRLHISHINLFPSMSHLDCGE